ncbi:Telomerase reverse transcriptase [Rhodosporidiobolus nylandii]
MSEVVDQVQQRIFAAHAREYDREKRAGRPAFATPKNVLAFGYRLSTDRTRELSQARTRGPSVTNVFPNTVISSLTSSAAWSTLLARVGPDPLIELFANPDIALFSPLPNACYLQVSGVPVADLKPLEDVSKSQSASTSTGRPAHQRAKRKRQRRCRAADERVDEAGGENASAAVDVMDLDESPSLHPPTPPRIEVAPPTPSKRPLRPFASAPLLQSPSKQPSSPPPHISSQVSPSKGSRLPLRATQSLASVVESLEASEPPKKRRKLETINSVNSLVFARHRMYHNRVLGSKHAFPYGFPSKHILTRLPALFPSLAPSSTAASTAYKGSAEAPARHLAKYIFPRQFGMHNPFTRAKKHGSIKTPTRLKPALELLGKLAVLGNRCNYRKLLDRSCPSKMTHKKLNEEEKSAVLELVSEPRTQLSRPDVSVDISHTSLVKAHGGTQVDAAAEKKPKLAEYACSFFEVEGYVLDVVDQVIPRAFWGSASNSKLIKSRISAFIRQRRWESTSVHALLQSFSVLDCDWLAPPSSSNKENRQQKPNSTDLEKRQELLADFLFWFFDGFVVDLVRTAFYVTDAATHQHRPLYFRQDDWNALCAPLLAALGKTVFEKVPPTQLIPLQQNRELGFSYVRLLPKETGVRPIVNLARRPLKIGPNGQKEVGRPINKILQSVFNVLTFERKRKPHLVGALVSDPNEIFAKLKGYKTRMLEKHSELPKIYFIKVDVRACYDTIQQDKLLEIVEGVVYDRVVRDKLLQLLREHITTNLVKVGGRLYRQKEGIPQGSVLSSLLCSLFYGDMEREKLAFTDDPDSVLLRYVDDFLLLTTKKDIASRFLRVMDDGIPEYGCSISAEKRLANFDIPLQDGEVVPPVQDGENFPWCGLAINTKTLEIQFSTQPQMDRDIVDQLTIQRFRKPGQAFLNAMYRATKVRAHALFCDTSYNSQSTAHANVYRAMLVVALKFQAYVQEWGVEPKERDVFLLIRQIISFAYAALVNRARAKKARLLKVQFSLKKAWVTWLGYHAFHRVLSRRPSAYSSLLVALNAELQRPIYALPQRHLSKVVASEDMRFADKTNGTKKAR